MAFDASAWRRRAERLEHEAYAMYFVARDDRTPVYARAFVALVAAYVLSPLDPVPDVIPVVGYLDELVVVPLAVLATRWMVPDRVLADARDRSERVDGGPLRWVMAALTVLLWVVLAALLVRAFA